jgi:DNA modification methylase
MGTKILTGNNMEKLREIESESVDCVVSSPPYFGLRDYGTGTWEGGDPNCPHKRLTKISKNTATGHAGMYEQGHVVGDAIYKQTCPECGAKRIDEQFGLEETLEEYIEKTVLLFEELRRVLKPQGTVWWNLGDSYANKSSAWGGRGNNSILNNTGLKDKQRRNTIIPEGLKAKDLMMIPARVAIALSENGWYLRSEIIWHKPNPMPESVKDRPTSAHEKIYLFSKNKKYYYDADAIREKGVIPKGTKGAKGSKERLNVKGVNARPNEYKIYNGKRNKRNVWSTKYESDEEERMYRQGMSKTRGENVIFVRTKLPTQENFVKFIRERTSIKQLDEETDIKKTKIEHWFRNDESGFAFPSVEDWKVIKDYVNDWSKEFELIDEGLTYVESHLDSIESNPLGKNKRNVWTITTKPFKGAHFAVFPADLIEPCIKAGCPKGGTVLDPFGGSGTTGFVANNLGRDAILIELNKEYVEIAKKRLGEDLGLFSEVEDG